MPNENRPKDKEKLRALDLETDKSSERGKRREEEDIKRASEREEKHLYWFTAIFVFIIIIDLFAFAHYQGLAALALGIMQIIFLIFIGYTLRIRQIPILLTKILKGVP